MYLKNISIVKRSHFETFTSGLIKNIIDLNDRCIYNIAIMKKLFVKYVSQNILGMVGMSLYILADTFLYIKGGRLKRYHRAQSGAACIQFDFCHRRNDRSRLRHQIRRREK